MEKFKVSILTENCPVSNLAFCFYLVCDHKISQVQWLKQQQKIFYLTILEAGNFNIKVQADSVFLRGLLLVFKRLPCCTLTGPGERAILQLSSQKRINPIMRASPSRINLTLITYQRSHLHISHWGEGFNLRHSVGNQHNQHSVHRLVFLLNYYYFF